MKKQSGITLIALVITIIVLLILAGIAISMLSGENGILKQAANAKIDSEKEQTIEKIKLAVTAAITNKEHKIEKQVLDKELQKYFENFRLEKINGYTIEINGDIYKVDENGLLIDNNYNPYTGCATINNSTGKELADYKIYGNSVQDGTPTPEATIEIESVGDKTKNLLNQEDLQKKNSWVALENVSNRWGYKLPIEEVGEYTLSFKSLGTYYNETYLLYVYIMRYDTGSIIDGRKIITQIYSNTAGNATPNDVEMNFTIEEGYDYYIWTNASGYSIYPLYHNTNFTNWQLEKGNVATEYEPYGYKVPVKVNNTTTNIYLDEPLRKVGDYVDYIDFKNQKIFRNVEVIDNTGKLTIEESYKGVDDKQGTNISLPTIATQEGENTIQVNTKVKPSDVEIEYEKINND